MVIFSQASRCLRALVPDGVDCGSAREPACLPGQDCSRVVLVLRDIIKRVLPACAVLCTVDTHSCVAFAVTEML